MLCRPTLTLALVLLCTTSGSTSLAAPPYQWRDEKDSLSLQSGEQVIYCFRFNKDEGCPYFHPLRAPGGPVMSSFSPPDHPWHRGLWFSWKYLNGTNYWEFAGKPPRQPAGRTAVVREPTVTIAGTVATVRLHLEYSKGPTVLAEEREIIGSFPRADRSYTIDWKSTFTAKDQDVLLDRTPPKGAAPGGYAGLGFRAAKTRGEPRVIDSEGQAGKQETRGKQARWMDYSGVFGDEDGKSMAAGIAIFDHPGNPRHPTRWYPAAGVPYFGPALLYAEPMTLKAGESFTLRYRILVHGQQGDKANLEKEWQDFLK